jgi:hypothetical protein
VATVAKRLIVSFIPELTTKSNRFNVVDHLCSCDRVGFKTDPAKWFVHELHSSSDSPSLGMVSRFDMVALLFAFSLLGWIDSWHVVGV